MLSQTELNAIERKALWLSAWMIHNANHLRPVRDGWVTGVVRPVMQGRSTQVWEIRITDDAGRLVGVSRCTIGIVASR